MDLTVDGRRVFAATGGRPFDPDLPAIIFVHGAGMHHIVWSLQTRYFAHHGRSVLAIDLPGHGRSEGPPLETIAEMADWVVRLMDAAGIESAALAGHSMGSLIALEAAVRHPDRVRALALLGAAPAMPVHERLLGAAQAHDHAAIDMIIDWGHGPKGHVGGNIAAGLWLPGGASRLLEEAPDGTLGNDLAACNAYQNGSAAIGQIRCPTRVICGRHDKMTPPRAGLKLADAIPEAESEVIEPAGHMMMTEAPGPTLTALKAIL